MKRPLNIAEAKRTLSQLVGKVAYGGEEITISRRDKPVARLVPMSEKKTGHLANVRGWLDNEDPFFDGVGRIIQGRSKHTPRAWKS